MSLWSWSLFVFVPLLAVIDPPAALPAFLAMTPDSSDEDRMKMAVRGCAVAAAVLLLFALMGGRILSVFGISLDSFRIAGGLILLLVALDSLQAKRSAVKETPEETDEGLHKDDVSVSPLAVPMLAGPGAISTVMVFQGRSESIAHTAVLCVTIVAVFAAAAALFYVFLKGIKRVSPIVVNVVMRLTGLLIAAVGVEFILSGLKNAGFAG
ncbi:MAG: hypothetical protein AUJ52_03670 [Elusimicrobia bacterium CG1_02_63_36]|nr:MAG: hypothetical protein AUJ52_03670 [Elusimicrobia bacterium CG1_02_63_36]PIP83429.1 MAG: antibiotic resistance protein MarC [Elusimicrobia bacterium CG22_combo_CG10-13_8_21_14_all_63_91]PJA13492.1 MAG: antibiotic resistance protein MarC [Elusimicrobia bacterium CG_4_10_14_0_2_um_filter_63_34]PJB25378.1 MAG: antibiotic resistance protein MarC [Elusimicrobia bacterium CG_4_9_14_3_um_filter_62_55]